MSDLINFFNGFFSIILRMSIFDLIDIAIVAYIFYKIFMFIKDTRAEQVFKGIVVLLFATVISNLFKLHTLYWILVNALEVGVIAICIIFQPELRTGFEYIGRKNFKFFEKSNKNEDDKQLDKMIEEIIETLYSLSRQKIGALIIMERETKLSDIINTGTIIDGDVSRQLLINIFIPNTPLHDGAVIISDFKVKAAACFLPLSQSKDLTKDLGTRHRAALGISEESDCIAIIISEETGKISIAINGILNYNLSIDDARMLLIEELKPKKELLLDEELEEEQSEADNNEKK